MSGQIIRFRPALRRAELYRQQAVPRPSRLPRIEEQLGRIHVLLHELDSLTQTARDVPPPVLAQARRAMDRARRLLQPGPRLAEEGDGDPQPEVDGAILDRLYRDLKS